MLSVPSERDSEAAVCLDRHGNPELRDTETVPLHEDVDAYKTKIGYEIPLNRHFYVYEPPRPLEDIEADLRTLEREIAGLLAEVAS